MTDSSGAGPTTGFLVADEARVRDALDGLARRIHATLGPDLHLVGIIRRGAPLAREIGRRLGELRDAATDVGTLRTQAVR